MEAHGTVPRVGVRANQLGELGPLLDPTEQCTSIYLDTIFSDATSGTEISARWRAARATLADAGAPEGLLARVDGEVEGAHERGDMLVVLGHGDEAVVVRSLTPGVVGERFAFGVLPQLGPLVEWTQSRVPYLAAVVDRAGADVWAIDDSGEVHDAGAVGMTDEDRHLLHRAQPGGWSQARFQRRVRNRWRANADEVAERLTELADRYHPRALALAGETRALELLEKQLPERVQRLVQGVDGSRAADGNDELGHELARMIDTIVASDTVAVARKLEEELGQHDRGVVGIESTLLALMEARVDTLLVHDVPADERTVWVGTAPNLVALRRSDIDSFDGTPRPARRVDAVIRAAFGTGAAVRVVPALAVLDEGIGAVLRH